MFEHSIPGTFRTITVASALTLALLAPGWESREVAGLQEPPTILPGSERVQGTRLLEYSARWSSRANDGGEWVDRSTITEELEVDNKSGRLVRTQTTHMGGGGLVVRAELDRATMRPISVRRTLLAETPEPLLSRLEQAGFMKEFELTFDGPKYTITTTTFAGETATRDVDLENEYFEGSTLGLLLAALPLQNGYAVRVPILFIDRRVGDVTPYWVNAEVTTTDEIQGVDTFQVDVGWADFQSGVVTSEPGPDQAGGAYWVTGSPPDHYPHVPRYRNESVDILLDDCSPGGH